MRCKREERPWSRLANVAFALLVVPSGMHACSKRGSQVNRAPVAAEAPSAPSTAPGGRSTAQREDADVLHARARAALVEELRQQGIKDERVLEAVHYVARHQLVPEGHRARAYANEALPIGYGQTISQPYIVALMSQLASVGPGEKVLEIGTGSGYQAAVLAELGAEVFSVEVVEELADAAMRNIGKLGYQDKVHVKVGDGYEGWRAHAPFDAILVTAAPPAVPMSIKEQLAVGGRLVVPVGKEQQELLLVTREDGGFSTQRMIPVRFVPMTGEVERRDS